jgi:hypothetical protein
MVNVSAFTTLIASSSIVLGLLGMVLMWRKGQDSRSNIPNQHGPAISGNPAVDISSSRLIAQTSVIKSPASCQTVFFA